MALSQMMQQYLDVKDKYKDALIFYRLGDFYEMFFDDAVTASKAVSYTISEPTRRTPISYAVFCLKKKKNKKILNFIHI